MSRGNRPRRMTSIPATSLSSGARIADLFPLPIWLFIPLRIIIWAVRHWYITLLCLTPLFIDPIWLLLVIPTYPLYEYLSLWRSNRHHSPPTVARAALTLARVRLRWRRAMEAADLTDGPVLPALSGPGRPVRIANQHGTALEFTLNLSKLGLVVRNLEDNKEYIVSTLNARRARVTRITPGVARLILEWEPKSISLKSATLGNSHDLIRATQLPHAVLDQNVELELDTSLLVVGESGSGKSNLTWHVINELNKNTFTTEVPYNLYVIDPKKVELAELVESPYTKAYSDSPSSSDQVIDKFYEDMMSTFERMKRDGLRKAPLGPEWPLNVLIIDELLLCKQATRGIDTPLGEILSAGRAAGFICIANSQLGQVDAISRLRDLFPQRVCMAVKSGDLTSAVLGPNAEARGARCTEITEKGVGYIFTDFAGAFARFRPPFITDVARVARGEVWESTQPKPQKKARQTCYTYRLYDRNGILLYVGKALNPTKRISQHQDKPFYQAIDHGRTHIQKYPSEQAALEAEELAIREEKPRYNLTHNH